MYQSFLSGNDHEWVNYEEIDNDHTLDDYIQINRDAEDAYFDSEEPSDAFDN